MITYPTATPTARPSNNPLAAVESDARNILAAHRGHITAALYSPGNEVKMTPERALAQALENNPEAYEAYRQHHNAAALISTLKAAGVRLS